MSQASGVGAGSPPGDSNDLLDTIPGAFSTPSPRVPFNGCSSTYLFTVNFSPAQSVYQSYLLGVPHQGCR